MKHSRPCSRAHDAVMSAPLLAGASTTTVASARPEMIRFRRGKVPFGGLEVWWQLRHDGPARGHDPCRQPAVDRGMQDGVARADDRDRGPVRIDRGRVRCPIDADRQPRHDRRTDGDQVPGELSADGPPGVGRPAGTDDRDRGTGLHRGRVAQDEQDVRRHLDRGQPARVCVVGHGHHPKTEAADPGERLWRSFGPRSRSPRRRPCPAAAARGSAPDDRAGPPRVGRCRPSWPPRAGPRDRSRADRATPRARPVRGR